MEPQTDRPIFRQAVLDRASSPERFDEVLRVTRPRGWIALVAIGLILAAVVVWGFAGSISNRVQGRGILVRTGGVLDVVAPAAGPVTEVSVEPGDSVGPRQVVVRLAQPELQDQLRAAQSRLAAARERFGQVRSYTSREGGLEQARVARERADLEASVRAAEESLRWLSRRLAAQQQLLDKGLITELAIQDTRKQYDDLDRQIREGRSRIAQLALQRLEVDNSGQEAVRAGRTELTLAELEVARLERELSLKTRVVTPFTGRVLEVMAEPGRVVERGEAVLRIDRSAGAGEALVAAVYVPSQHGKRVQPGMRIHLAPSTVRQEEYGMMVGTVVFVSDYPATTEGMLKTLKNQKLVQELSGEGAPYQIYARLTPARTPSRYRWSSSQGPPTKVESGTLVDALVSVQEQRPAELVLPALRRWTGVQGSP